MHIHPVTACNNSVEELAKNIALMRYDALADFLYKLHEEINKQVINDFNKNRINLSMSLEKLSDSIFNSAYITQYIWNNVKKHMMDELEKNPEITLPMNNYSINIRDEK